MHYCNAEHQKLHFPKHKSYCSHVGLARTKMETEEKRLREFPGDFMTVADPFTNGVGHFWGILETRTYMRLRFGLVEALSEIHTHDSVAAQYDHFRDMIRLSRGDNMGVRLQVPALLLRLDRDQEAYDFIKWYQTTGQSRDYDWGDMSLGFLDVKDADAFEDIGFMPPKFGDLSFSVSMTLIKIRLLLDLQNLTKAFQEHGAKVPNEILDSIRREVPRSSIISNNRELIEQTDHSELMDKIKMQINKLYKIANEANKHFWPALIQPGKHLGAEAEMYTMGSVQEMRLVLNYNYYAWKETPGSIDIIKAIKQGRF
jgi:hypothetical protein